MIKNRNIRFKGAPWYSEDKEFIILGGAGGIGSWLALLLSRANFKPAIYDDDNIESHNLGGQLFRDSDIGRPKANVVADLCKDFSGQSISYIQAKYTEASSSSMYMFSAFDNMEARKDMFANWCRVESTNKIFIDGRLNGELLQIFCVTHDKVEAYKKHLFEDSEVADGNCTLKSTSHTAAMIASYMVAFFTNHMTNLKVDDTEREVPFFTEIFIPLNLTTTKDE
jgi:molybdopterin/thiamine biosynthesis adenylyltransferase